MEEAGLFQGPNSVTTKKDQEKLYDLVMNGRIYYPYISGWWDKIIHGLRRHKTRRGFLMMQSGKVAGGMILKFGNQRVKICHLQVLPEYRKQGAGSIMMKHVIRLAKGRELYGHMDPALYKTSRGFWKKKGFKTDKTTSRAYRGREHDMVIVRQ